jgi:3-isopropylmalate/(R)-2-methylmalate dehydratase large subunit
MAWWKTLCSDPDAKFDREITIDCSNLEPQLTWGTDPGQVVAVTGNVPDPARVEADRKQAAERAIQYMGLQAGQPIAGVPVDRVFIGSCTNSRLSDLESAASVVRGRRVAAGVTAFVVPGSSTVKRLAEQAGLDKIFRDAGFEWHESGCSMCAGANGDLGKTGERVISTSNRNFENRQGPGVRTPLASPAMAAAAAVAGRIVDVRSLTGDHV